MKRELLQKELISYILNFCRSDGLHDTKVPSLKFYVTTEKSEFQSIIYEPSICFALQGEKAVGFGEDMYSYNSSKYLLTCTNIPADIKIETASKQTPYVSLVLSFSLEEIYEVIKDVNEVLSKNIKRIQNPFCFNKLDNTLLDPVYRLVKLLDKTEEMIKFMYPLIKKEIIYILLQNNEEFLKNYVMEGTLTNQIVKAISEIKNNFNSSINIANLAKDIGISEASLYQNFKRVTSMSPLQYQKKIRLQEAKQMLLSKNIEANEVAFSVGYESPSQFSREYARMYGMPPKAHSEYLKER